MEFVVIVGFDHHGIPHGAGRIAAVMPVRQGRVHETDRPQNQQPNKEIPVRQHRQIRAPPVQYPQRCGVKQQRNRGYEVHLQDVFQGDVAAVGGQGSALHFAHLTLQHFLVDHGGAGRHPLVAGMRIQPGHGLLQKARLPGIIVVQHHGITRLQLPGAGETGVHRGFAPGGNRVVNHLGAFALRRLQGRHQFLDRARFARVVHHDVNQVLESLGTHGL